jgi:hypothetical protein
MAWRMIGFSDCRPPVLAHHVQPVFAHENQDARKAIRVGDCRAYPLQHLALDLDADARRDFQKGHGLCGRGVKAPVLAHILEPPRGLHLGAFGHPMREAGA